jgi:hypothetical protein
MDPNELHRRLVDASIPDLIDVLLPQKTYERINTMMNSVLTTPVPDWMMSLYAAQDGLTAGYYHYRNVERVEHAVDEVARRIYADAPADMPATNMSFAARKLSYEYQAFVFALRRSFDYLAGGLTLGLGCTQASSFKDVPKKMAQPSAQDRDAADAISMAVPTVLTSFREIFGTQKGQSLRDQIAHRSSVPGGQFTVSFRPGQQVAVELEGGGERLPFLADPAQAPGRLSAILLDRLVRFENVFMDLTAHLPAIAQARTASENGPANS